MVDTETNENLGPNHVGEIRVKSTKGMNGYYNMDACDDFDEEGFMKTGDLGYYNEDFCFFVVDRSKELLKFRSWQIAPAIIEDVLMTHPAVVAGIVIGIPHEQDGDHPMGIVILKSGTRNLTAEEIRDYVDKRVDEKQKLRAGLKIVESFPYTPSGKPKRREVKNMILNGEL